MTREQILNGDFVNDIQTYMSRYTITTKSDINIVQSKTYVLIISGYTARVYSIKDICVNQNFDCITKDLICTIKLLDVGFRGADIHTICVFNNDNVLFSSYAYDKLVNSVHNQSSNATPLLFTAKTNSMSSTQQLSTSQEVLSSNTNLEDIAKAYVENVHKETDPLERIFIAGASYAGLYTEAEVKSIISKAVDRFSLVFSKELKSILADEFFARIKK